MAEDSINVPAVAEELELDLPVTMENIGLHVSVVPEKMGLQDGNLRGNSSGERGGNGRAKVLPRYLSSPTGSCHDLCKYGIKPVFRREANLIRTTLGKGEDLIQTETVAEQEKKSATHINTDASSPRKGMNSLLKHDGDLKMRAVKTKPSVLPMGSKRKSETEIAREIGILPASPLRTSSRRSNNRIGSPLCTPRSRSNSFIGPLFGCPASGRNTGIGSPLGCRMSGRNTGIGLCKDKSTSVVGMKKVSALTSVKRVGSIKTRPDTNVKGVSPLKNQSNARKTEFKHPSNENAPEKILHVIEPKPAKGTVSTPSSEGKSLTPAKSGTHVTHLASFPEGKKTKQAQTGVHTSAPPRNKSLQDAQKGIDSHKSSASPPVSSTEYMQSEDVGFISKHSAKQKERPNSVAEISSGDEDYSPCKLNSRKERDLFEADPGRKRFERKDLNIEFADIKTKFEKVVLKHQDTEGTRNSQTSPIEKVVLKHLDGEEKKDNQSFLDAVLEVVLRHQDAEDKKVSHNVLNNAIEVALRHQNVEYKKENQSLLNSMIEETASKLVEAQQSKVKALVGAFESLISLQDLTPSATARAH